MRLPRTHKHARVELLPLMDVVFLILIFLVYAMMSMLAYTGMPISLPASSSGQPERVASLALTIERDGRLWLDKEPVSLDGLGLDIERQMHARKATNNVEPNLHIFADAALPYQKLFDVLSALKAAGLRKISLQAKKQQ